MTTIFPLGNYNNLECFCCCLVWCQLYNVNISLEMLPHKTSISGSRAEMISMWVLMLYHFKECVECHLFHETWQLTKQLTSLQNKQVLCIQIPQGFDNDGRTGMKYEDIWPNMVKFHPVFINLQDANIRQCNWHPKES